MITRRQFSRAIAAGLVVPALSGRSVHAKPMAGVRVGVQTYSFRELPRPAGGDAVDVVIAAMRSCGLDECELWSPQLEPAQSGGDPAPSAEERQRGREA